MSDLSQKAQEKYRHAWSEAEASGPQPHRMRNLVVLPSEEFYSQVLKADPAFVESLVGGLYAGDLYMIKGAFSRSEMDQVRQDLFDFAQLNPSSFHKMLDGTPDFHRIIEEDTSQASPEGYSLRALRHAFHFYRWNGDSLGLFKKFEHHWQTLKIMSGLVPDAYEPNLPSDGVVDRIVCYRYPPGGGNLRRHLDPTNNHKYFTGIMLSERGVDYDEGGIYCIDSNDEIFDLEPWIKPGDFCFAYPTVEHGVTPVDPDKKTDWTVPDGRWFIGFSSVDSDHVEHRKTGTHID